MSGLLPVALYGLKVPAGDVMIPAAPDFPATFRITMAAIDPSASPEHAVTANGDGLPRATLKVVYDPSGPGDADSEDSEDEEQYFKSLLTGQESDGLSEDEDDEEDEESSDDEEEKNGGPSDPSKSKKARKEAAAEQILRALAENGDVDSDDEMDLGQDVGTQSNGNKLDKKKGKGKARLGDDQDDEGSDEDEEEGSSDEMEEVVICTLDPQKNYQQPLDITIPEDQHAYFKVSGTHAVYLTGNYVVSTDGGHKHGRDDYDSEDEQDDYDFSPDEDELDDGEESDELDALEDPRITEVSSEDETAAPELVRKEEPTKKGKNKRLAEDVEEEPVSLDAIIAKSLKSEDSTANGEAKLSKKQLKKLKTNAGKAVETATEDNNIKKEEKADKKVQFAKNLEQGPSSSPSAAKPELNVNGKAGTKKSSEQPKTSLGPKTVQGVKIDDKKLGQGPAAKKGDKVGMRYIGKLKDGKVFDANKKGKPFSFKLGQGEVIKGWDIGVEGMTRGNERRLVIPASLAYGSKSMPGIPANSELTFDVKLLEIN